MRRTLGPLLLTLVLAGGVLAGCGADTSTDADDPSGSGTAGTSSTPASPSAAPSGPTTVAVVSATGAGGQASERVTVLDSDSAVRDFARQFTTPEMSRKVEAAATAGRADLAAGRVLVGAVVAIGCDVPDDVSVEQVGGSVRITALKVASPRKECFAPVTSVALVAVDAAMV